MNDIKAKSLAKNTVIILIGKFCTQFLSFFILPFITRFLTTGEYGSYDLISTYSWLLAPFLSIQLENGIFRFLIDNRNDKAQIKKIISTGIFTSLLSMILISIILFLINILFKFENFLLIYILSISTIFLNLPLQISRGLGDNVSYAKGSIIAGVLNVFICFISVCILKLGMVGMVISNIISNFIGGIYIIFKKRIFNDFNLKCFNEKEANELVKYSMPLVPNSISSWIMSISDKVMISFFIGVSANGIYSISTKFSILLSHLYSVFNLSWTESASVNSNDKEKDEFFSIAINNIFKICSFICILTISAMPIIFKLMINKQYNESYIYIPILILGTLFEIFSGLLGAVYISFKFSKKIALSTFLAGLINILINLLFMKRYGIIVACVSTIIAYMILTIYRVIDLKKYINIKYDINYLLFIALLYVINLFLYYKNSIILSLISTIILILTFIYLNRRLLIGFLNKIINSKVGVVNEKK